MTPEEASIAIDAAREKNEFSYVEAVGRALDEAERLRWFPWRRQLRLRLYQVVANLDIDDKLISEGVNTARSFLEKAGVACEPSIEREYAHYLEKMPPFDRHLMLAKQAMSAGASGCSDAEKNQALFEALRHYQMAAKHGVLSKKHLLMVGQLKKRLGT